MLWCKAVKIVKQKGTVKINVSVFFLDFQATGPHNVVAVEFFKQPLPLAVIAR